MRLVALYKQLGFAKSTKEAERAVQSGGARLNGRVVDDHRRVLAEADFLEGTVRLSMGKRKHGLGLAKAT